MEMYVNGTRVTGVPSELSQAVDHGTYGEGKSRNEEEIIDAILERTKGELLEGGVSCLAEMQLPEHIERFNRIIGEESVILVVERDKETFDKIASLHNKMKQDTDSLMADRIALRHGLFCYETLHAFPSTVAKNFGPQLSYLHFDMCVSGTAMTFHHDLAGNLDKIAAGSLLTDTAYMDITMSLRGDRRELSANDQVVDYLIPEAFGRHGWSVECIRDENYFGKSAMRSALFEFKKLSREEHAYSKRVGDRRKVGTYIPFSTDRPEVKVAQAAYDSAVMEMTRARTQLLRISNSPSKE